MLSYQHIYHAGNAADLQKHMLLAAVLSYLTQKDKPLSYLETHSGRGLYMLDAPEAVKTGEAEAGITAALSRAAIPADHPYAQAVSAIRAEHGPTAYPGSPMIAAHLLRPMDSIQLAELHPREHDALRTAMRGTGAKVYKQDGFELAQAMCPPSPRRGLCLIDPSYEVKEDYARIPREIANLHRKWNVGIIALWYPILTSGAHKAMLTALKSQNLPDALIHEVHFPPVREGHRMIGSGMYIVNAPWGTDDAIKQIDRLFPKR
ncbi:23S rRNA (adenine(2030)-N(6))-methyltransferase RlmJ [Donghicola sp. C2-DW-16]|uniref:Ribosomal RNA large subunit methyltransferase J n=1 Tax=Donghicola mangrovi TaxID=2729614 RepID=A0ABX2P8Z1_9RHOB|nr:23S rRNA (adenine(2030)-N(6))-methyltransferase RlmJ [Donghicola mangrovi]NVO25914.1 23S rRNA (adenine(2030)-N(6))-methyltransferase RlmJ [Donghicola mangrovi]